MNIPLNTAQRVLAAQLPFCGVRQSLIEEARRRQFQWVNKTRLRWYVADRIPSIPLATQTAVYAAAWNSWQSICGLTFEQTSVPDQADIVMLTRAIDGLHGTLAEAELPMGDNRRLRMWIDLGDRWHAAADLSPPTVQDLTDLLAVVTHEAGHNLGLSHEETQATRALMDPFYNASVRQPLEWDIQQAQRRYGPPVHVPAPPVVPIPGALPDAFAGSCELLGNTYRVEFVKQS